MSSGLLESIWCLLTQQWQKCGADSWVSWGQLKTPELLWHFLMLVGAQQRDQELFWPQLLPNQGWHTYGSLWILKSTPWCPPVKKKIAALIVLDSHEKMHFRIFWIIPCTQVSEYRFFFLPVFIYYYSSCSWIVFVLALRLQAVEVTRTWLKMINKRYCGEKKINITDWKYGKGEIPCPSALQVVIGQHSSEISFLL